MTISPRSSLIGNRVGAQNPAWSALFLTAGVALSGLLIGALLARPLSQVVSVVFALLLLATWAAIRHPVATLGAALFAWGISGFFLEELPTTGNIQWRLTDPLLFGMVAALISRALLRRGVRSVVGFRELPLFTVLLIALIARAAADATTFGFVKSLGEFRTYYGALVVVPYIGTFVSTEVKRRRLIQIFLVLSVSMIIFALFQRAGGLSDYGYRWIDAPQTLTLGFAALIIVLRIPESEFGFPRVASVTISAFSVFLVFITGHRSVWLAMSVAVLTLIALRALSIGRLAAAVMIAAASALLTFSALNALKIAPSAFLEGRLSAFTNPSVDATADWRLQLWRRALDSIERSPWWGQGLGRGFEFRLSTGEIVETSPHNQYVNLAVQVGLPMLILYLVFVLVLLRRLIRARRLAGPRSINARVLALGIIVLIAVHTFYLTYSMEQDWMSWTLIGLAISISMSGPPEIRQSKGSLAPTR